GAKPWPGRAGGAPRTVPATLACGHAGGRAQGARQARPPGLALRAADRVREPCGAGIGAVRPLLAWRCCRLHGGGARGTFSRLCVEKGVWMPGRYALAAVALLAAGCSTSREA